MSKKTEKPVPTSARELVPAEVGGQKYMVRPPKGYIALKLGAAFAKLEKQKQGNYDLAGQVEMIETIIDHLFVKSDAKKIRARLLDPTDDLDAPDLINAYVAVQAEVTKNPTTSAAD